MYDMCRKEQEELNTNMFFQMLCHKFMTEYDLDGHIAGIRELYGKKCALMLKCLDEHFPECIKFTRPEGDLFIWCTLPIDGAEFVRRALEKKIAVVPGATFNADPAAPSQSFRLNYSMPSDENIIYGVKVLGEVAREMLK